MADGRPWTTSTGLIAAGGACPSVSGPTARPCGWPTFTTTICTRIGSPTRSGKRPEFRLAGRVRHQRRGFAVELVPVHLVRRHVVLCAGPCAVTDTATVGSWSRQQVFCLRAERWDASKRSARAVNSPLTRPTVMRTAQFLVRGSRHERPCWVARAIAWWMCAVTMRLYAYALDGDADEHRIAFNGGR